MDVFPVLTKRFLPAVLTIDRLGHDVLDLVIVSRDGLLRVVPVLHALQVIALFREAVVTVTRLKLLDKMLVCREVRGHTAAVDKEHRRNVLLYIILLLEIAIHAGKEII